MSNINKSPVSKPFIVTAVVLLFVGSSIGSLWMMSLFGIELPSHLVNIIKFHKILQLDGFITLIIMGIGYMIVPRFRNISTPSPPLAYLSFLLVVSSIIISFHSVLIVNSKLETLAALYPSKLHNSPRYDFSIYGLPPLYR
jgi:cbb3-type cytochrome oxidase subunit 1